MVLLTWLLPQYEREERPSNFAYFFRQCCVILATVDLLVFVYLSFTWGKDKLYLAICEWLVFPSRVCGFLNSPSVLGVQRYSYFYSTGVLPEIL